MRPAARGTDGPLREIGATAGRGFALSPETWPAAALPRHAPGRGEIHVWGFDLDVAPERLATLERLLSAEELERAWRFRQPEDRLRFIAGRGTLRRLLGACLQVEPRSICFRTAEFGKPSLAWNCGAPGLCFNVSGSEGLALVALSADLEVGVDLERVRDLPELATLARRLVSSQDAAAIESAPPAERTRLFLEHWVRHEALAKAAGLGLRQISNVTGTVAVLTPPRAGFVAAVAATAPFERATCRTLAG
jgi:4'-phosphopantetheinyl transferase